MAVALAAACASEERPSDDDDGAQTSASSTAGPAQGGSSSASSSAAQGGAAQGGGGAGGACMPPAGDFNSEGCLTFESASAICGFDSDGSICAFSVGCGLSDDQGQCQINCEMGTTVNCYDQAAVDCLYENAICTASCTDLGACGWIL